MVLTCAVLRLQCALLMAAATSQFNIVPKARALCGCFCASRAECTLLASALLAVEAAIYLPRSHMAALKEAAEFSVDEDRNCVVALRAPGGLFFKGEEEDREKKDEAYERHEKAIEPAWRDARRARALARRYLRRVVVECEEEEVDSFSYSKRSKRRRVPQGEFAGISPPSPETHRRREARKESQRALKRREPYRYSEQGSDDWHGHDLDDDDDENNNRVDDQLRHQIEAVCSELDGTTRTKTSDVSHVAKVQWDDVGGLAHVRSEIMDAIELQIGRAHV